MDFLTQQQEVAAILGLDETQADQGTLIRRWLNITQRDIADAAEWPFLQSADPVVIQLTPDVTTGTATSAAASTAVTISTTLTPSMQDRYVQFSGDSNWFRITAHTTGTDTLTISPPNINAQTAVAYTIREFFYDLTVDVDRITRVRPADFPFELVAKPWMFVNPWSDTANQTGSARTYSVRGLNRTTRVYKLFFWPFADTAKNVYVETITPINDLTADTDVSIIPEKWHTTAMLHGALWRGYDFLNDTRASSGKRVFDDYIRQMKQDFLVALDEDRELKAIDGGVLIGQPLLPGQFPLGG